MNVDRAEARHLEERLRQDLPVGGHRDRIGCERADPVEERWLANLLGLRDLDAEALRELRRRRHLDALPATRRAIGLRDDERDGMLRLDERAQRGNGELGCAEEDDRHGTTGLGARCGRQGVGSRLLRACRPSPSS